MPVESRFATKNAKIICTDKILVVTLHSLTARYGSLAEWLGTGLQNRLQQFESARNLKKQLRNLLSIRSFGVVFLLYSGLGDFGSDSSPRPDCLILILHPMTYSVAADIHRRRETGLSAFMTQTFQQLRKPCSCLLTGRDDGR